MRGWEGGSTELSSAVAEGEETGGFEARVRGRAILVLRFLLWRPNIGVGSRGRSQGNFPLGRTRQNPAFRAVTHSLSDPGKKVWPNLTLQKRRMRVPGQSSRACGAPPRWIAPLQPRSPCSALASGRRICRTSMGARKPGEIEAHPRKRNRLDKAKGRSVGGQHDSYLRGGGQGWS